MKTDLPVRATRSTSETYRELLIGDWNLKTLDSTIELINNQLPDGRKLLDFTFDGTLFNAWHESTHPLELNARFVETLDAYERAFPLPIPTRISPRTNRRSQRLWERLLNVCTALVIPSRYRLKGASGLFLDSLSLLYLTALHALIPQLRERDWNEELQLLWHVMWVHCQASWRHDLAHQQYLSSCLFRELEMPELEEQALRNAFSLTAVDDHDFLSKAQAVWSFLLDRRRYSDAREFVLYVARIAPANAIKELREMLDDTMIPAKSA